MNASVFSLLGSPYTIEIFYNLFMNAKASGLLNSLNHLNFPWSYFLQAVSIALAYFLYNYFSLASLFKF